MQKPCRRISNVEAFSERGFGVSPLVEILQAASCVARDDRDGCSRYSVSKISGFPDDLGWYREYISSPLTMGARFIFL